MTAGSDVVNNCVEIFRKRGKGALERAKQEIVISPNYGGMVTSALKYFARVTLRDALPVFPGLISLSCEAAGGNPNKTSGVGAALLLIAGAADVHDDVMDKSAEKYNKKTVYGKYGIGIALLVGDALLFQGLNLLHNECDAFSEEKKKKILNLVSEAFLKISKAEAKETFYKGKLDIPPEKYSEILRLKCVIPQVHCQIGAVVAGASNEIVSKMGEFGMTYGIASSIAEEFADLLTSDELENRIRNECAPLPFLYALQNPIARQEVLRLTSGPKISAANLKRIADIVMELKEVQSMCKKLKNNSERAVKAFSFYDERIGGEFASLLSAPSVSLQSCINKTHCGT